MALQPYASKPDRVWYYAFRIYCALVFLFLIIPILIVVPMGFSSSRYLTFPPPGFSLQYFEEFLNEPKWVLAIRSSFAIGLTTMVCATVIGTMAAVGLVRGKFRGKAVLTTFLISPMVIPLIITAVGLYFLYSQIGLVETFPGMVMAHTVLATPFVVIVVSATLHGFDRSLELAAVSLGASPVKAFIKVTLPVIAPGIVSGALFAFIISFDEVVVALFLSGMEYRTLPVKMFEGIRYEVDPAIAAVATLVIFIAVLVLTTAELLRRRGERLRGIKP